MLYVKFQNVFVQIIYIYISCKVKFLDTLAIGTMFMGPQNGMITAWGGGVPTFIMLLQGKNFRAMDAFIDY